MPGTGHRRIDITRRSSVVYADDSVPRPVFHRSISYGRKRLWGSQPPETPMNFARYARHTDWTRCWKARGFLESRGRAPSITRPTDVGDYRH